MISYNFRTDKTGRRVKWFESLNLSEIMPPNGRILRSIAVPRVSGTIQNVKVRNYIKSEFNTKYWNIETDEHVINTPLNPQTSFTNLIITLKPVVPVLSKKRLIIAAHFDSKYLEFSENHEIPDRDPSSSKFVGATDSAWSCSLLVAMGKAIELEMKTLKITSLYHNVQFIFFDGEEAVKHWSQDDSLYGSRALADKWSKLPLDSPDSLENIELFLLLDLLGSEDAKKIYSFHPEGSFLDNLFKRLIQIELTHNNNNFHIEFFQEAFDYKHLSGMAVEDDHTPFQVLGVNVLHLIPLPFPASWHTSRDTIEESLHPESCEKLAIIIYKFIKEFLVNK